jgi:cation:H+ antiporter
MMVEMNAYLAFFVGLVILSVCGDWLVSGSARLGRALRLSPVFIGVCIIGFGTSLPELLATVSAAVKGSSGLALGNVIGSNIANIGLIMALGLLLCAKPMNVRAARMDYLLMLGATALFSVVMLLTDLNRLVALVFLAGLGVSIALSLRQGKKHYDHEDAEDDSPLPLAVFLVVLGLCGLFAGAEQLVDSAIVIAAHWGVPDKVVGLTMVAVGTSLPELAAAIASARRNEGDMILGNILGSNIFNLLAAASAGGLFATLSATGMGLDIVVMVVFAALLGVLFTLPKVSNRVLGLGLAAGYAGYVAVTAMMAM